MTVERGSADAVAARSSSKLRASVSSLGYPFPAERQARVRFGDLDHHFGVRDRHARAVVQDTESRADLPVGVELHSPVGAREGRVGEAAPDEFRRSLDVGRVDEVGVDMVVLSNAVLRSAIAAIRLRSYCVIHRSEIALMGSALR